MPASSKPSVAILGLGLIGGSLAAALRRAGYRVTGWDLRPAPLHNAVENRYITSIAKTIEEAVIHADLVILAMYIGGIIEALEKIGPLLKPGALVLDVGSTKAHIVAAMNRLPEHVYAVGGHPMTGKETAGVEGIDPDLFRDRIFVLTPTERTTSEAMRRAADMLTAIHARPIIMSATEHDQLAAVVSHLVRLVPIALIQSALSTGNEAIWHLAAGGFRESTRAVTAPLGFWDDVFATNPHGIAQALRGLSRELDTLADAFDRDDIDAIRQTNQRAAHIWHQLYGDKGDTMKRVIYLGIKGAFSEQAARQYFGDTVEYISAQSFSEIFHAVQSGEADYGILPIENSLAGTVAQSYELLTQHDVRVVGEVILHIEHALLALPGVELANIKKVRSHPQALEQCAEFIKRHHLEPVSWYNTAGSAKDLAHENLTDTAAIASPVVAEIYGLNVLAHNIQDMAGNYTRFLILGHKHQPPTGHDKTSLIFVTTHKPGSLVECLLCLSTRQINLTKIESRPQRDKPWEYIFYIDFEGHEDDASVREALADLTAKSAYVRVLGSYPAAAMPGNK
jgi:prephenate dehydratase/prephenate dehydrogenase